MENLNNQISTFLQEQISDNEKIVFVSHISNFYLLRHILLGIVFLPLFGIGVLFFLVGYFMKKEEELVITNKRVIYKSGIVKRKVLDIEISTITSTTLQQDLLGRFFNYSTIILDSYITPLNPQDIKFNYIKNYSDFRKTIGSLIK